MFHLFMYSNHVGSTKIAYTNAYFNYLVTTYTYIHININIYYNGFIPSNVWKAYETQYFFMHLKSIFLCKLHEKSVSILFRL